MKTPRDVAKDDVVHSLTRRARPEKLLPIVASVALEGRKPMGTVTGASGGREATPAKEQTSATEASSAKGIDGPRPTIYDVARVAGVATSTVSRALSNPGRVSFKTAEHIRKVAKELGYRSEIFEREIPDSGRKSWR
jgi:hypothetical protein